MIPAHHVIHSDGTFYVLVGVTVVGRVKRVGQHRYETEDGFIYGTVETAAAHTAGRWAHGKGIA